MIKLTDLILEETTSRPKLIVMAGGAGAGKSHLLSQLGLQSLPLVNPDKYVEDRDHPAYNNLSAATAAANREAAALADGKTSFVWDTTASNPKKVKELLDLGYDIYMVMVYAHPMIAYVSNFSRERSTPSSAVFSTWRNVYQLIGEYDKMLNGQLAIYVNDRGNQFKKEIESFDLAAKSGVEGVRDYLQKYNTEHEVGGSSFFKPVEWNEEEENEFNTAAKGIDWDTSNRSEDKAIKQAFIKAYRKNGVGPGADKLKQAVTKYRDQKVNNRNKADDVLANIADMLYSPKFQEKLEHSTPKEVDAKLQAFLA
jgi:predicted kinase